VEQQWFKGTTMLSGIFIVLWSTAWIAGKFGLASSGPMTLLFLRFLVAALVLLAVALATRSRWPTTWSAVGHMAVAGVLIQAFGLGGVYLGMNLGVNAGISALICGLAPLLTALGAAAFLGDRMGPRHWLGLALGVAGIAIVVADHLSLGGRWQGYAVTLGGLIGFVAGTLYQKKFCNDMDLKTGSFIQTLAAAAVVFMPALGLESLHANWNESFIGAVAWMALVNSVIAMTLLMLLLSRGSASQVSTLFYLVPPLTAFMAFVAFGEALTTKTIIGFVLVVGSVYMNTRSGSRVPAAVDAQEPAIASAEASGCRRTDWLVEAGRNRSCA
jgi:drug/metabolite transporter (DMT)-like permease